MKTRYLVIYILFFVAAAAVLLLTVFSTSYEVPEHTAQINRLLIRLGDEWDSMQSGSPPQISKQDFDYCVLDENGDMLFTTKEDMSKTLSAAVSHYDIIREIMRGDEKVGTLIVHNPIAEQQRKKTVRLALSCAVMTLLMLAVSAAYFMFLKKRIVEPFKDMKAFAERIAAGELDTPLDMDKGNIFGAFSESFDIMREELKASRKREEEAVRSRKEMIASLSHDIKTPVASIKAMADVMELTAKSEDERSTLRAINEKADSIDKLISNLFHATLEELNRLPVNASELGSDELAQIIKNADHLKKLEPFDIPDCVFMGDKLRIEQVAGNIITNSYKYAGTPITVNAFFEQSSLCVEICDSGGGADEQEIFVLTEKFRRGSNAQGKDGSGIGLYISDYFMKCMGGSLSCRNTDSGFCVSLRFKLA